MSRDRYAYSYGNSTPRHHWRQRVLVSVMALIALALLAFSHKPFAQGVRTKLLTISAPALELVATPVHVFREVVADKDAFFAAIEENKKLREENETLHHWQAVALALKAENESLRGLSGYQPVENVKYVTARVVGQSAKAYGANITLNAGSREGIAPYQPVIDGQGLIGRVTVVSENTAQVMLLSDANSRVPVITGTTRQHAILAGTGEDLLRLTFLDGDPKAITLGEPVATTEEGALIPGGILVGSIFRRDEQGLVVKPARSLASAEYVRVVVAK